jgi:hypothetical protein
MTGAGPTSEHPQPPTDEAVDPTRAPAAPTPSPAALRAGRMNAANMLRSLLPLVVICLLVVGWQAFRSSSDVGVRTVDPSSSAQLAAARASYPVSVPEGLDDGYRPTSARTDAGNAADGDPVTLEIGYLTPSGEFAGFVIGDDRGAEPVADVLDGAVEEGTVDIDGETWLRSTTEREETALSRETDGVFVLVHGSAPDEELAAVAAAVEPFRG